MLPRRYYVTVIALLVAGAAHSQEDLLDLDIGDPARRHDIEVTLDAILDTERGEILSAQALRARLQEAPIVLVGEQHTDAAHHAVQLRVLELLRDTGRPLVVALEMFPADLDPVLDAWTRGELDEPDFLARSDWYRTWGYDWRYYRAIFLFARMHAVPMIGLRARDASASAGVTPDLDSTDHETLLRAFFEADSPVHGGLTDAQFASLFEAQSRRDAQMGARVLDAQRTYPDRAVVVLAGTGHVLYGLGIARQLPRAQRLSAVTIMPIPIAEGAASATVSASVGDFVWGIVESAHPAYPELGVLTSATSDGLRVIFVEPDSPAAIGGIATGDLLTHYEGRSLTDRTELARGIASARWGDEVAIALRRDDATRVVRIALRRRTGD
jgi:uncharacterized iron-regulated protein